MPAIEYFSQIMRNNPAHAYQFCQMTNLLYSQIGEIAKLAIYSQHYGKISDLSGCEEEKWKALNILTTIRSLDLAYEEWMSGEIRKRALEYVKFSH